ncbi:hypothetical protein [Aquimarina sp. AU58]|uniref:hypothetical protein n=1 Tax=Aquimarina sp. AU58 TaxID=1874112 RepID=UPI00135AC47E|nr:hypothetical protein [Aquimarina sp. AU58]
MKKLLLVVLITIFISSCNSKLSFDAKGFEGVEENLKGKFGDDAFYTELSITYVKQVGTIITTTVTKDPSSLKMESWNFSNSSWSQTADVTLELSGGKAQDFMFNLNEEVDLSKLGELVESSIKKLKEEKDIDAAVLNIASIMAPNDGDKLKMNYFIQLKPENGGTDFTFVYNLDGTLEKFDY